MQSDFKGHKRDRIVSAAVAAGVHLLLAIALLRGLGVALPLPEAEPVRLLDLAEPPPPAATPPRSAESARKPKPRDPEGAASPASLKATPTEIVAPPPPIPIPVPPPVAAAPVSGTGAAPSAGAAPAPGPGTGAGGQGSGLGSGGAGSGTGGGGGGGTGAAARLIRGSIDNDDYPRRAFEARATGTVYMTFTVDPDGRVRDCRVTRTSGHAELDATTCRLIRQRFRYRPARDAAGRPIPFVIRGRQQWEIGPEPPVREIEPELVEDE